MTPRPYTIEDFATGLRRTGAAGSLTLDVLTATLDDQLALLARARDLGLEFVVELGNEIYWG